MHAAACAAAAAGAVLLPQLRHIPKHPVICHTWIWSVKRCFNTRRPRASQACAVLLLLLPLLCCCCLQTATPAQLLKQFDMTFSSYHQEEWT
jgi:hypothetical protein